MSNNYQGSTDTYKQGAASGAPLPVVQNNTYQGDALIDASKSAIVQFTNFLSGNTKIILQGAKPGVVLDFVLFCGAVSPTIQITSDSGLFFSQLGTNSANWGTTITPFVMNPNTNRGLRVYVYANNGAAVGID